MEERGARHAGTGNGIARSVILYGSFTLVLGVLNAGLVVSIASLVFSQSSPEFLPNGVALYILAGGVGAVLFALVSSYRGVACSIQDVPAAVAALMAGAFAAALAGQGQEAVFATTLASVAVATALSGLVFLFLGQFKLGNLVRFIPYPVMGGFLAGTGWILLLGGVEVATGVCFHIHDFSTFQTEMNPAQLGLGLGLGLVLLLVSRYRTHFLVFPALLFAALGAFALWAVVSGTPPAVLADQGWLLGEFPDAPLYTFLDLPDFSLVQWRLIVSQAGSIGAMVLLNAITFLLYSGGLELAVGRDLDVNRDMKRNGFVNMALSPLGAPAQYVLLSDTILAHSMGARTILVGICSGGLLLLILFFGGAVFSLFPAFIAGGLLCFLGLSFLVEWLVDAWKKLPKHDYALVLSILVVVGMFGFLYGIFAGLAASVVVFTIRYSLVEPVRGKADGMRRSSKERPVPDQRLLDLHAGEMLVLQIQGFLFFGTAHNLYLRVKKHLQDRDKPFSHLILDMRLVDAVDSSVVQSFEKIALLLEQHNADLYIASAPESMRSQFEAGGLSPANKKNFHYAVNQDHALELCEDRILDQDLKSLQASPETAPPGRDSFFESVHDDLMAALEQQELFERVLEGLQGYVDLVQAKEGDFLYRQDEPNSDLFFILRGNVSLRHESDGAVSRVSTLGPWSVTNELGSFLGYPPPFSAKIVEPGEIYKLTTEARERLDTEAPALVRELRSLIIRQMGGRLWNLNLMIRRLQE